MLPDRLLPRITLPDGRRLVGHHPGQYGERTLLEHRLSVHLAHQIGGLVEVRVPFGRADVATAERIFEVESWSAWREGIRQVLAYAGQTGLTPALALFGTAKGSEIDRLWVRLKRDVPHVELWWYDHRVGWAWLMTHKSAKYNRYLTPDRPDQVAIAKHAASVRWAHNRPA